MFRFYHLTVGEEVVVAANSEEEAKKILIDSKTLMFNINEYKCEKLLNNYYYVIK